MKSFHVLAAALALTLAPAAFAAGGNVTVSVLSTGVLNITGDGGDNQIAITPDGPSAFVVTGLNGTTVNLTGSVSATAVRSIRAVMGGGDDRVEVTGGRVRGDLRVNLDDGADVCVMTDVRVRGATAIRGGDGPDQIHTAGTCTFQRSLTLLGEAGNDFVRILDADCFGITRVDTGQGDDTVTCTGAGFGDLSVRTGAGDDNVSLDGCSVDDDVKVDTGADDDHVTLDGSSFDDRVQIYGGSGNGDNVSVHSGNDFDRLPKFRGFES